MVSGCPKDELTVACIESSWPLGFALTSALLLVISLAFSLWTARPAALHFREDRPRDLFLISHVASLTSDVFVASYREASLDKIERDALLRVHSKAGFATTKFYYLRWALDATLASLLFLILTIVALMVDWLGGGQSRAGIYLLW
jgi:hypothetical protein